MNLALTSSGEEEKNTINNFSETGTKTLLGKIVGVYKVGYKSEATRTGVKLDLLIMENLFYKKEVDKSYDLKVSLNIF